MSQNVANANLEESTSHGNFTNSRGKGRGRGHYTLRIQPTFQLCGKIYYSPINCWNIYDKAFNPHNCQSKPTQNQHEKNNKHESSNSESHVMDMVDTNHLPRAYTQEYIL